jgi:hypothetical protein
MDINLIIRNSISASFYDAMDEIVKELKHEALQQGHRATGSLIDTIEWKITKEESESFVATIFANSYWVYVENGVTAAKIPYTVGGRRRGGTSKYIEGLKNWAKVVKPELNEKQALGFAFAVARKHKKEGMPTRGSYSFSRNGRRLGFVQNIIENHVDKILAKVIDVGLGEKIVFEILKEVKI